MYARKPFTSVSWPKQIKIKTLSRNKDPTTCDLDIPDAFQNTYRLLPHNFVTAELTGT